MIFEPQIQKLIAVLIEDICNSKDWVFEAMGSDFSHVHTMVSWRKFHTWEQVDQRLKNLLALKLNRRFNSPGKRWFVRRHGAPRRAKDKSRYAYLINTYFPDHRGFYWKKGDPLPTIF